MRGKANHPKPPREGVSDLRQAPMDQTNRVALPKMWFT